MGKEALEKMKTQLKNGEKPYKLQLVGLELGGKPIDDYANDFYLISNSDGGKPVGYITSHGIIQKRNKYSYGICSL